MLGTREDAEEVVQDTFIRAYRALGSCQAPERFGAWCFRILVNRCRTAGKRQRRRNGGIADLAAADQIGVPHPEHDAAWREELGRAIDRLSLEQREAFLLKHVDDLSYQEMREVTGASVSALKMRVNRACERLRVELSGVYRG
jgi:RNA polymerase sigma-70 factor (ECF subfamily)